MGEEASDQQQVLIQASGERKYLQSADYIHVEPLIHNCAEETDSADAILAKGLDGTSCCMVGCKHFVRQ